MKKIIEIEGKEQVVEISVKYDLGGYHYGTGAIKPRGYYVSAQPITMDGLWRKFEAFTGVYKLLFEVGRKSSKQYEKACDMVTNELIEQLIAQCTIK